MNEKFTDRLCVRALHLVHFLISLKKDKDIFCKKVFEKKRNKCKIPSGKRMQ